VDARRDPIAKWIIHKPVTGKAVLALECRGNDQHVEMATPRFGPLMAMVLGAVIANGNRRDGKRGTQTCLNFF
jgi:hypothetical protein